MMQTFMGTKIVVNNNMTRYVEDWSGCRSRSRAERRQRQGHKQRVKMVKQEMAAFVSGNQIFVGPETYQKMMMESDMAAANLRYGVRA
jgi:hypothetical protein